MIRMSREYKEYDKNDVAFIRMIRARPELYDRNIPNYRNIKVKDESWRAIAVTFDMKVRECQVKWKNLRDRYVREQKRILMSRLKQALPYKSKWSLVDEFQFLDEFVKHTNRGSTNRLDSNGDDEVIEWEDVEWTNNDHPTVIELDGSSVDSQQSYVNATENEHSDNELILPHSIESTAPPSYPCTTIPTTVQTTTSNEQAISSEKASSNLDKDFDEDKYFCLSLVPALRRLPRNVRALTKLKIHQLVYEAEFKVNGSEPSQETDFQKVESSQDYVTNHVTETTTLLIPKFEIVDNL